MADAEKEFEKQITGLCNFAAEAIYARPPIMYLPKSFKDERIRAIITSITKLQSREVDDPFVDLKTLEEDDVIHKNTKLGGSD